MALEFLPITRGALIYQAEKNPYNLHRIMPAKGGEFCLHPGLLPDKSLLSFLPTEDAMNIASLTLCLVTQFNHLALDQYLQFLKRAIAGGVTSVQLRDKTSAPHIVRSTALAFKSLLAPLGIPLIINDYVELAAEIDADGVHIGQADFSPVQARTLLGPDKAIGYSIESFSELEKANELNCIDYVAASAVFASKSKQDCKTIWGLAGLKQLSQLSKHPVVAIGGINLNNVGDVIRQGACGVAVISAIQDSINPVLAARELIQEIEKGKLYV
jgi:thiamine-phosphate pyrophosphorylase